MVYTSRCSSTVAGSLDRERRVEWCGVRRATGSDDERGLVRSYLVLKPLKSLRSRRRVRDRVIGNPLVIAAGGLVLPVIASREVDRRQ